MLIPSQTISFCIYINIQYCLRLLSLNVRVGHRKWRLRIFSSGAVMISQPCLPMYVFIYGEVLEKFLKNKNYLHV